MTKGPSTLFGEPLSAESKKLVNEVRLKITQPIHPNFDTDFNVYRFVLASERLHRKEKEVVDTAAKALNNHLRMRKALGLDEREPIPFDENPIFVKRLLPNSHIQDQTDDSNRLLWFLEYASISVESLSRTIRTSQSVKYQFWQFETMLRRVMVHEEKTGKLSGLRHVIDMHGYEMNPFAMLFVSSGMMAYYMQLLHYDNYPELVTPIDIVNIARWMHVPYKIARPMMPASFNERVRLHDAHFMPLLTKDIAIENIPENLGGKSKAKCIPAVKAPPEQYWYPTESRLLSSLETVHVSPRKSRQIHVDISEKGKTLSWYFKTDGDIFFGVFYQAFEDNCTSNTITTGSWAPNNKEIDLESLEMVYPWMKLAAKMVHEVDGIECTQEGRYWIVFCNKQSWIQRRTVDFCIQVSDKEGSTKRYHSDGTYSAVDEPFEYTAL